MIIKIATASIAVMLTAGLLMPQKARAFFDPTGPAQVAYLAKILMESINRYQQLKEMIHDAKNREAYIRAINAGIDNSIGLLESLPIKDEKVLADLKTFKKSLDTVQGLYGAIPKSPEEALHVLHDQSVAESLKMVNSLKEYTKSQEENSIKIMVQARDASPKGAARMTAQTNAQILHTANQSLRMQSQSMKLESERLALENKREKDRVRKYQDMNKKLKFGLNNLPSHTSLIRF